MPFIGFNATYQIIKENFKEKIPLAECLLADNCGDGSLKEPRVLNVSK
jgi:hypothetical protein